MLRRSKTSYLTLQVALYYLKLIQSCIPKYKSTIEQSEDSLVYRPMQCGRRIFLSALILASKYLQDRNHSARAWSNISGFKTCEISQNELVFLFTVNWKLHIPVPVFHRWTDIVLKCLQSANVIGLPKSYPMLLYTWGSMVPLLTTDFNTFDFGLSKVSPGYFDKSPPLIKRERSGSPRRRIRTGRQRQQKKVHCYKPETEADNENRCSEAGTTTV